MARSSPRGPFLFRIEQRSIDVRAARGTLTRVPGQTQNGLSTPTNKVRRIPYCGAPTWPAFQSLGRPRIARIQPLCDSAQTTILEDSHAAWIDSQSAQPLSLKANSNAHRCLELLQGPLCQEGLCARSTST